MQTIILGTGSVLPELVVPNAHFSEHTFFDKSGVQMPKSGAEMADKLGAITGIRERRYVPFEQDSVPLMAEAARRAVADADIDVNQLDGIIVAHNAGNMLVGKKTFHTVPNMAALLKNAISCTNHACFAYDILFGCPGWLQGIVQAHQAIQAGDATNVLVVGIEVASRMLDPHDPDSMILADGCGAAVLSLSKSHEKTGVLGYATFSHSQDDYNAIYLGVSNNPDLEGPTYFHMNGKEVYRYATTWVPQVIKKALEKAGIAASEVDMFLFHQANEKMLQAFVSNLSQLFNLEESFFANKVPATIHTLGNTSVATIPTMLDMIMQQQLEGYDIKPGQIVVMASVGAGMHCNAIVYQF